MGNISLFYADEKEIDLLYSQISHEYADKRLTLRKETMVNVGLNLEGGLRFIPLDINGKGEVSNNYSEEINTKIGLNEKIKLIINKYKPTILNNQIKDGEIVGFTDYFILISINNKERVIDNFDHIDSYDFTYALTRMREDKSSTYKFEMNKRALENMRYESKNDNISSIVMRMHSEKINKGIHHYSEKVREYVPFLFNIVGEISIIKNGYIINPFVVWR